MNKEFWMAVLSVSDKEVEPMLEMLHLYERRQEEIKEQEARARVSRIIKEDRKAWSEAGRRLREAHPEEFEAYLREEREAAMADDRFEKETANG